MKLSMIIDDNSNTCKKTIIKMWETQLKIQETKIWKTILHL